MKRSSRSDWEEGKGGRGVLACVVVLASVPVSVGSGHPLAHSSASWVVPCGHQDLVGSAVRHRAESLGDPRDQGSGSVDPSFGVVVGNHGSEADAVLMASSGRVVERLLQWSGS